MQPREIKNPKEFLDLLKEAMISDKKKNIPKKSKHALSQPCSLRKTLRTPNSRSDGGRYLFTFRAIKPTVIQAIESGLGKHVEKIEIKKRKVQAKKAKK